MSNKEWRIIDIINWSKDYFEEKGVDSPRLTIELILSHILGLKRIELYTNFEKPLKEKELKKIREYVVRRGKREPIQYILGEVEFNDIKLKLNNNTLIPRPETEELTIKIIEDLKENPPENILDIGTGSGCIAISLAKFFTNSNVTSIDVSKSSLEIAKENAELNKVDNVKFIELNILENTPDSRYDLIVSNPPYVAENEINSLEKELQYEPKIALTDSADGITFFKRFVTIFPNILSIRGGFYLELGENQSDEVSKMFIEKNFEIQVLNDLSEKKRFIKGKLGVGG